jgi:predicted PurR-regulated permease PerM
MQASTKNDHSLASIAYGLLTLAIIIVGLVHGRPFLVPIVIAVLIAILVAAGANGLKRVYVPEPLATLGALLVLLLGIAIVFNVLAGQADAVAQAWPRYVERLNLLADHFLRSIGPEITRKLTDAFSNLDLVAQIPLIAGSAGGFLVTVGLVAIYVGFLLVERGQLSGKIDRLFGSAEDADEMQRAVIDITESIRRYLWIKTLMSLMTSVASYAVLRSLGVDFAETWALMIFFLNYIPSVGAIIGVGFPALLALVQFETFWQFFMILTLLTSTQIIIGNVIEPSLMGRSLNLSPFVVIASLAFWALVWGVVGAFLSVPLTTALIIVCSHVPSLRWLAIILSANNRAVQQASPPNG